MIPTIISCYTKNTIYEEEINDLILSCKALNLEYDFESYQSKGSWERNCCFKPEFILKKLLKYKKALLWVDADGIILRKPVFEDEICNFDISFCTKYSSDKIISIHSGTIFINYSKDSIELLKSWIDNCQKQLNDKKRDNEVWDQRVLFELIFKKLFPIKHKILSEKYCYIFDRSYNNIMKEEIVIMHFQASRNAKYLINNNMQTPLFLKNLPPLELKKIRF